MKFENFIGETKKTGGDKAVWLSNDTFNDISEESEKIRINKDGQLELCYRDVIVQLSISNKLYADGKLYFAEVMNVSEYANYTGLKKNDIFTCPEDAENVIIL